MHSKPICGTSPKLNKSILLLCQAQAKSGFVSLPFIKYGSLFAHRPVQLSPASQHSLAISAVVSVDIMMNY